MNTEEKGEILIHKVRRERALATKQRQVYQILKHPDANGRTHHDLEIQHPDWARDCRLEVPALTKMKNDIKKKLETQWKMEDDRRAKRKPANK